MAFATKEKVDVSNAQDKMEETLEELIGLVNREVHVFQELLATLNAQYQAVLREDVDRVWDNTTKVRELVEKTKMLEKNRIDKTAKISTHLGLDEPEPTLVKIIPLVELQYSNRLRDLRTLLISLSKRIKDTNLRNKRLLNRALNMVNTNIRLLTTGQKKPALYNEKGAEELLGHELFNTKY